MKLQHVIQWHSISYLFLGIGFVFQGAIASTGQEIGETGNTDSIESSKNGDQQVSFVEKPVWELGLGAAHFSGYDYPASSDPNEVGLVLPFYIYRSQVVRVDGGAVGAVALERPQIRLDFSLGGSLNAESEGNAARESMPDLDFLLEFGPRLNILLSRSSHDDGGVSTLRWLNSARSVISTDFSGVDSRGFLFKSELEWERKRLFGTNVDFQIQFDTQWATRKLHSYFYQVAPEFVTPERPLYKADAGYLGSNIIVGFGYRFKPTLRLFAAVNYENYSGAANDKSPLYETDSNVSFAVALVWTARKSAENIKVFEDN